MKRTVTMALAITICAGAARADHLGIYWDPISLGCYPSALAMAPTVNYVYVVHKLNPASQAAVFKVQDMSGLVRASAVLTPPFLMIGDLFTGASIAYTSCVVGDIVVAKLGYLWLGQPLTCGYIGIVPNPTHVPSIIVTVDCNFVERRATAGWFAFGGSRFSTACSNCEGPPIAVRPSTWGSVKALYRW